MENKANRNAEMAARVQKTAKVTGFEERYVYMVLKGERRNEEIMSTYMFLFEGENKLIEQVKKLIPFNLKRTA